MNKILVTGGAGYIGSHTVLALLASGRDVVIFDSLECGHAEIVQTLQQIDNLPGKILGFVKGDLTKIEDISSVFDQYQIDSVIHFAAYIRVEESVQNPQKYYKNNVGGTLNLLDAMLKANVKHIVFSSTAAVYGEPESNVAIEESPRLLPVNPYGQSKLMVEKILRDFDRSYDFKSAILRYFNVAGADHLSRIGEWHEPETHLIPNVLNAADGKVFKMFGNDFPTIDGTCVRDYVNVEDLADAHVLALKYLERENKSDCFNIGTNSGNTVKEIFQTCEKVLDRKIDLQICGRRDGDPAFLVANNQKARTILGWSPKRSLEDSIRSAYQWQKWQAGK